MTGNAPSRTWLGRALAATAMVAMATTVACSGGDGGSDPAGAGPDGKPTVSPRELYQCPATPAGVEVGTLPGNRLPDLTVKDCEGNDMPLARFCQADATWLYVVHTWCPHCRTVGQFSEPLHDSYVDSGKKLVSLQILLQNDDHAPPTAADCKAWKQLNKLADNVVLYDSTGAVRALNDSTRTSLSVFLDKRQVIRGKSHSDVESVIRKGIDEAFSAK